MYYRGCSLFGGCLVGVDDLSELGQILIDVFDPLGLLLEHIGCCLGVPDSPFVDELAFVPEFSSG